MTDLTGSETAVLMVLMAEARAVRNPELSTLGPELKKASRDKLVSRGLVETTGTRPMSLELTDKGWKACADLMGSGAPAGARGADKALYTVLAGLGRWFERDDVRPAEVFFPRSVVPETPPATAGPSATTGPPATQAPAAVDVEQRVRDAYARLRREPGAFVRLSRLRTELGDLDRKDVDETIVALQRLPGVSLIPEENQKTLTDDDRAAAVVVGNQDNHLLKIDS